MKPKVGVMLKYTLSLFLLLFLLALFFAMELHISNFIYFYSTKGAKALYNQLPYMLRSYYFVHLLLAPNVTAAPD